MPFGTAVGAISSGSLIPATKVRLSEYQAAIGFAQLKRLEAQTVTRNINAAYLSSMIKQIPGITPYKLYDNVTRAAFHLFPFRYDQTQFNGLSKAGFIKSLQAEGLPANGGYTPLNTQPFLKACFASKNYQKIYSKKELDYAAYLEHNQCPMNDQLCSEAIWFTQNLLLGTKAEMEIVAHAIEKIQKNSAAIKKVQE